MTICKKIGLAFLFAFFSVVFAESASVVSVAGKVEVQRGGAWVPVSKGEEIKDGELVSTGFKSEAILKYKGSVMKLGPLTRISIDRMVSTEKKDDVSVYLKTGVLKSTVKHTENKRLSYTVRNQIAVASVRGTDFDFYNNAEIVCNEGGIVVAPASMWNSSASESSLPSEGDTNAFTSSEDLNSSLSDGVVLTAGQQTEFSKDSVMAGNIQTIASKEQSQFSNGMVDAASKESESFGSVSIGNLSSTATYGNSAGSKAVKVIINVSLEQ